MINKYKSCNLFCDSKRKAKMAKKTDPKYTAEEYVEGVYRNDPQMGRELHALCRDYYKDYFIGVFNIDDESAKDIFQDSMVVLIINIMTRKIYVEDGVLKGNKGEPFKSSLTTYFMGIAKNKYYEWKRKTHNEICIDGSKDIQEVNPVKDTCSIPYIQDGFWCIDGKSTGVEVAVLDEGSDVEEKIPYIGKNLHWLIGKGDKPEDLGGIYDNNLYTDEEIKELVIMARRLANMADNCKHILTLFYYYEKDYDEIMKYMTSFNSRRALITAKSRCLERLRNMF